MPFVLKNNGFGSFFQASGIVEPYFGSSAAEAAAYNFAAPPQGELGVWDLLPDSAESKLQATPASAAGPCPKSPKNEPFF